MGLGATIYNAIFKRTSAMIFATVIGAFVVETIVDYGAEGIFNNFNKGKLWHHIEDNYKLKEE